VNRLEQAARSMGRFLFCPLTPVYGGEGEGVVFGLEHYTPRPTPSSGLTATFSPWKGEKELFLFCPLSPGYGGEG
jgi:hypothetical protein